MKRMILLFTIALSLLLCTTFLAKTPKQKSEVCRKTNTPVNAEVCYLKEAPYPTAYIRLTWTRGETGIDSFSVEDSAIKGLPYRADSPSYGGKAPGPEDRMRHSFLISDMFLGTAKGKHTFTLKGYGQNPAKVLKFDNITINFK